MTVSLADFSYELPEELIAQTPPTERGDSRLLIIDRHSGELTDTVFSEIARHLPQDALLVMNDTRVIPARMIGTRANTGGRAEVFLVRRIGAEMDPFADGGWGRWEVLVNASKAVRAGHVIKFAGASVTIVEANEGIYIAEIAGDGSLLDIGQTPLPPYIRREPTLADVERYQTVYAARAGAVAAPTAGLHFTQPLLDRLDVVTLTLHVGVGTFLPIRESVESHRMHEEFFEIPEATQAAIDKAKKSGRPVVAVGTTTVRALESEPGASTDLFITPGHNFEVVDALVTNFHLPGSTLLLLVSAFASRELILRAYAHAVDRRYRFYSYGDATLIR